MTAANWWISCPRWTVWVQTRDRSLLSPIVDAAPIVRWAVGRPVAALLWYASGRGAASYARLKP